MDDEDLESLNEAELLPIVESTLPLIFGDGTVAREPRLGSRARPDFIYETPNGTVIAEVKSYGVSTERRLTDIKRQLAQYADAWRQTAPPGSNPGLALFTSSPLSDEAKFSLTSAGISTVVDGPALQLALGGRAPALSTDGRRQRRRPGKARELAEQLRAMPAGRKHWSDYQRLVRDILEYLWHPPLEKSLYESSNALGHNRRDMIFPNYAASGFWDYLRGQYSADHVVVDAKNLKRHVPKDAVLQMANYLTVHGAGLFGTNRYAELAIGWRGPNTKRAVDTPPQINPGAKRRRSRADAHRERRRG